MPAGSLPVRAQPRAACRIAGFIWRQPAPCRACSSTSPLRLPSVRPHFAPTARLVPRTATRCWTTSAWKAQKLDVSRDKGTQSADRIARLKAGLAAVEAKIHAIFASDRVEQEQTVLEALDGIEEIAQEAIAIRSRQPVATKPTIRQSTAGAILSGLGGDAASASQRTAASQKLGLNALPSPSYLSKLAENLIKHPTVFISNNFLTMYIHLQRLLSHPRTIPEAFYLYANKPIPIQDSSPPKFSKAQPKSAKQAIPPELADEALTAAIEAKDMTLALCIVDQSYCAPAWRRRRIIQKFGLPAVAYSLCPLVIYTIAQEASVYSNFINPNEFKWMVAIGFSTYVTCTSIIGYVALTTYNDHHDRVVWLPGTALTERYLREDERAALDRIACSWGFKELWRRGEEDGEEWEGLRQVIARRAMVLDKPDLMPGMNPSPHPRELDHPE